MRLSIALFLFFMSSFTWAAYQGIGVELDTDCGYEGQSFEEIENVKDEDKECRILHDTETDSGEFLKTILNANNGKRYRTRINTKTFYKFYQEFRGKQEITYLLYKDKKIKEDPGILPDGEIAFEPGVMEEVEFRFHIKKRRLYSHAVIIRKKTFDILAQKDRIVFHVFKLRGRNSCLLGFVNEIETARRVADSANDLPCAKGD